jgi:hypothetical protein
VGIGAGVDMGVDVTVSADVGVDIGVDVGAVGRQEGRWVRPRFSYGFNPADQLVSPVLATLCQVLCKQPRSFLRGRTRLRREEFKIG